MTDFDWPYVVGLVHYGDFWKAAWLVTVLSTITWLLGTLLGFVVALAKQSRLRAVRYVASTYIWFFRSLPLLVLLIFVYNLPQFVPATGVLLSEPFWAGLIALVISETAYIAEIHRGGLLSIARGQHEAAHALGIRYFGRYRYIVVPQALRVALPALSNEFVTIVKLMSLVSVISLAEILLVGQRLYTSNFKVMETMVAVAAYYVLIVSVFNFLAHYIEHALDVTKRVGKANTHSVGDALTLAHSSPPPSRKPIETTKPLVSVKGVCKSFGDKLVLNQVSFDVMPGQVISIIGPSGSGKTTLIRTINALQDFDAGSIRFDEKEWIHAENGYQVAAAFEEQVTQVGMVFQNFNLFPHLTVLENITFAPRYHGQDADAKRLEERAHVLLDKVGLLAHAQKYPHQLSGGQQQRVAIARALAMQPRVMLFDEPTSALDPELVNEVLRVIEMLAQEGMTMVIVTHEMRFALGVSDQIIMMEAGQIVAKGSPDELRNAPADSRISSFLMQSQA